ncbi:nuclear transport factor 2 family protein [Micromonospora sp. NPDC053740]|uniref:nuclear transport factor 2 family protein n=1 Tax=Micromonospora sp. NPDC053740 TaxID=3155173 RepID=UPI00343B9FDA
MASTPVVSSQTEPRWQANPAFACDIRHSVWTVRSIFSEKPDGTAWLRLEGREQIAATIGGSNTPGDTLIHHLFSDEIDVDAADDARGVFAMEDIIIRPDDAPVSDDFPFKGMHGYGHYHARFRRGSTAPGRSPSSCRPGCASTSLTDPRTGKALTWNSSVSPSTSRKRLSTTSSAA